METKKQMKYFTIFDYEKEQDYLRQMHQSGWRFVKVSGLGMYHFEKCQPQDVVYQLDYNQEGLANKEEYVKMFSDCGWEYIQDFVGYSYFRKAVSDEGLTEEIFCDEQSRQQMMERVLKGRMTPVLGIFCAVLFPQFVLSLTVYHNYVLAAVLGGILALYTAVFVKCARKLKQHKGKNTQ